MSPSRFFGSPFFSAIKDQQPFSYNTLRPCPMIDHPNVTCRIIQEHKAGPTHQGAEETSTTFAPEMAGYAATMREIMDDVWDNRDYRG